MHFTQIEGDLLRRGIDPFDYTVRQMISVTESWFLSFDEPSQWAEVREKMEGITAQESTTMFDSGGAPIPVSKQAMDDMNELLAAASGPQPEPDLEPGAETGDHP